MKALDPGKLKRMVRDMLATSADEIGCDECFEQLDRFVDLEPAGKRAAEALPLVQDHLNRCHNCREEFEVLLTALRADALNALLRTNSEVVTGHGRGEVPP
jgi:hypothetical protein